MRKWIGGITLGAMLLVAQPVQGQVAWESPQLLAPGTPAGLGIFLMEGSPGSGLGVLMTWRGSEAPGGIGFRLGLAEDRRGDLSVLGGVDFTGSIIRHSNDFPLDVIWATGVGLGVGDWVLLSVPFGVSMGRALEADGVRFNPYVAPRLILDARLGDRRPGDRSLDLNFALDLGADVSFGGDFSIRFGASLGDRDALAIGVGFPVF